MIYSKSILILGDTDIEYVVSKEYNDDGFPVINIISDSNQVLSLSHEDAKDVAKALSELANGY